MLKQIAVITGVFLIYGASASAKGLSCHYYLGSNNQTNQGFSNTQQLIAYFQYLLDEKIVTLEAFTNLVRTLQATGEWINPIAHKEVQNQLIFTSYADQVHHETLETQLRHGDLNRQEFLNWALAIIAKEQKVKIKKEQVREDTRLATIPMIFNRVEKGNFVMGDGFKVPTELKNDFEVMSTLVTQWMWAAETGENPAVFKNGNDSITVKLSNNLVTLQPDHPIENITWYAAAMFANRLSEKQGLKKVYDFSRVKFKAGTRFEDGTLDIESGEMKIYGAEINSNEVYETEGYRLPTEAELEYLSSDRGRSTTQFFTGITNQNLSDYAWFQDNSAGHTHAVARKAPYVIDGKEFYDLHGNVCVHSHSWLSKHSATGQSIIRGGGWDYINFYLRSTWREFYKSGKRDNSVGFRLVRSTK